MGRRLRGAWWGQGVLCVVDVWQRGVLRVGVAPAPSRVRTRTPHTNAIHGPARMRRKSQLTLHTLSGLHAHVRLKCRSGWDYSLGLE